MSAEISRGAADLPARPARADLNWCHDAINSRSAKTSSDDARYAGAELMG
jgi:hypothetical protein